MNPTLTERLFAEFPQLFRGRCLPITQNLMGFGFECGDGWYDIVHQLAAHITAHAMQTGLEPLAMQVKQELGVLRFSVDQADEPIYALCAAAEQQSSTVCEQCGAAGQLRYHRRQLQVCCDEHAPPGSQIAVQQPHAGPIPLEIGGLTRFDVNPASYRPRRMDWNRLLSRARLGVSRQPPDSEARTDFQRDFDRIVFSSAFRRLQDKTQVFPLSQSDYVRTRLTHSLEVSSVGRSLGTMVGDSVIRRHQLQGVYPQDFGAVVAAACLAHDIGNPPFGHAGEDAIRLWFTASATGRAVLAQLTAAQRQDFLRFEGNAQGFRIITRLQSPDNPGGMQLTCAMLGAFTKYPCASALPSDPLPGIAFKKFGFYQDDQDLFAEVAEQLGLEPVAPGAWKRHPLAWLVEAADDICYRIIDVEDAFRLQLLRYEEVRDLLLPLTGAADRAQRKLAHVTRPKERIEYLRAKAIGTIIEQAHQCFMENEDAILAGGLSEELLDMIPTAEAMFALKQCGESQIYVSRPVVEVEAAGFEVLGGLLEAFVTTVNDIAAHGSSASPKSRMLIHLIPEPFAGPNRQPAADCYRRVLAITDFVSGMTDSYAVTLFKKITGISLPTG